MRAGDRRHKGDTFRQPLPWVRKTPTTQSDVVAAGEAVGLKSGEGFSRRVTRARSMSLVAGVHPPFAHVRRGRDMATGLPALTVLALDAARRRRHGADSGGRLPPGIRRRAR